MDARYSLQTFCVRHRRMLETIEKLCLHPNNRLCTTTRMIHTDRYFSCRFSSSCCPFRGSAQGRQRQCAVIYGNLFSIFSSKLIEANTSKAQPVQFFVDQTLLLFSGDHTTGTELTPTTPSIPRLFRVECLQQTIEDESATMDDIKVTLKKINKEI